MAVRITEAQTAQVRDDAYVLVTQKETVNGAETEVLRRVAMGDVRESIASDTRIQAMIDNTVNPVKAISQEAQRRVNALMKVSEGVLYEFEERDGETYSEIVPSGAELCEAKKICGKTVRYMQMVQDHSPWGDNVSGQGVDYTYTGGILSASGTANGLSVYKISDINLTNGHRYLMYADMEGAKWNSFGVYLENTSGDTLVPSGGHIVTSQWEGAYALRMAVWSGYTVNVSNRHVAMIDLTEMFGETRANALNMTSNEIKWLKRYIHAHPGYNEGELVSADVSRVMTMSHNMIAPEMLNIADGTVTIEADDTFVLDTHAGASALFSMGIPFDVERFSISYDVMNITGTNMRFGVEYEDGYVMDMPYLGSGTNKDGTYVHQFSSSITNHGSVRSIRINWSGSGKFRIKNLMIHAYANGEEKAYAPYYTDECVIPESVRGLDGYGWSAGSACNSVEQDASGRWWYVKRVGSVDGVVLSEPVYTDITDMMLNAMHPMKCETGGRIVYENGNMLDVPNETEYMVSLKGVVTA